MISKNVSINQSLIEQDLVNYNHTDFSKENNNINNINKITNNINNLKSNRELNIKNHEQLIEIEIKNIHMLILQRSLYILKRRFVQNKKEIELTYEKYKEKKYKNLKCITTRRLYDLYNEIMSILQINLLPYENFNELMTADLMSGFNKDKNTSIINELTKYTKKNIEKYNQIFYENKIKKKKLIEKKIPKPNPIEVTKEVKIIHINKRGEIIHDFEEMIENNKEIKIDEIIYTINEDDISILINKRLLYNDVIPLIIADFLQENMKNNIYIGITLSTILSKENDDLNENIKVMYDNEIIKKYNNINRSNPKEEKNEKLKNLLFETNNIDTQIKIYKKIIIENSTKGIESSYLVHMIQKLTDKKIILQKTINDINRKKYFISNNINNNNSINSINTINYNEKSVHTLNTNNNLSTKDNISYRSKLNKSRSTNNIHLPLISKKLSKEQIRENNILEIFLFYCKQHSFLGKTPTIDSVLEKEKYMNLSEFTNFCQDFEIFNKNKKNNDKIKEIKNEKIIRDIFKKKRNIEKKYNKKINDIFIKNTKKSNMSFEEFKIALNQLSIFLNEEKKQNIKEQITLNQLKLEEIIEKEKIKKEKRRKKKKILKIKNEEMKNEQNNLEIIEQIKNQNNQEININNNINNIENNINEIKYENENINKEENKNINENEKNNLNQKENKIKILVSKNNSKNKFNNNDNKINKTKRQIKNEESIFLDNKENLEEKISKLKNDFKILENKSLSQLEEELYIFLEIDDNVEKKKKMKGHIQPFMTRGEDIRNPKKNVKYPIKFEPKNIRDMYDLLMQKAEDLKKENELKKMKEKEIQFEKRQKIFNKEIKKLEKDYDEKIKKDNYQQIKRNEDDYIKIKNSKLTWKIIQKNLICLLKNLK